MHRRLQSKSQTTQKSETTNVEPFAAANLLCMNATWNRDNEVSDFPRVVTDFGGHAIFKLGNP